MAQAANMEEANGEYALPKTGDGKLAGRSLKWPKEREGRQGWERKRRGLIVEGSLGGATLNASRNNGPSHGAFQQGHYSETFSLSHHIPGGKWRVGECTRTSSCRALINMRTCSRRQLLKARAYFTMQAPEHRPPLSLLRLTD